MRDPARKTASMASISSAGPKGGEAALSPHTGVMPGRAAGLSSGSLVGPLVVAGSARAPRGVINMPAVLTASVVESPSGVGPESTVSVRGSSHTPLGHYSSHLS